MERLIQIPRVAHLLLLVLGKGDDEVGYTMSARSLRRDIEPTAYKATRPLLARRGTRQRHLADSHPAGRILGTISFGFPFFSMDQGVTGLRGPRYLLLLAQSPSAPSASASFLGKTARLVIPNPSSPASRSIENDCSLPGFETTRAQVMTGGGASSSSPCSGGATPSSATGESMSDIWNVSVRLWDR